MPTDIKKRRQPVAPFFRNSAVEVAGISVLALPPITAFMTCRADFAQSVSFGCAVGVGLWLLGGRKLEEPQLSVSATAVLSFACAFIAAGVFAEIKYSQIYIREISERRHIFMQANNECWAPGKAWKNQVGDDLYVIQLDSDTPENLSKPKPMHRAYGHYIHSYKDMVFGETHIETQPFISSHRPGFWDPKQDIVIDGVSGERITLDCSLR